MEKVQFQLEATLPELKDLEEKGLFSKVRFTPIHSHRLLIPRYALERAQADNQTEN